MLSYLQLYFVSIKFLIWHFCNFVIYNYFNEFQLGPNSGLHIIIFDEIDAICKARGSTGSNTGVHDTVVNQLLSKIDGVEQLNNILVIGMTNRRDMIDEALLRPGRLEVSTSIRTKFSPFFTVEAFSFCIRTLTIVDINIYND